MPLSDGLAFAVAALMLMYHFKKKMTEVTPHEA